MEISYRQWWLLDASFVLGVVALAAAYGQPSLGWVAVAYLAADRGRAYWQTGNWLSQPAATPDGGDD